MITSRGSDRAFSSVFIAVVLATTAAGQDTPGANKDVSSPSAAHEKMEFFRGTWVLEPGGIPESIARAAGTIETCDWLNGGRRHMICRKSRELAGGGQTPESMYILSYREQDATYVAYFAFPSGDNLLYHGKLEGDRWVMTMQPSPLLPANQRFRTIITPIEGGMRFVEEGSKDGGPWVIGEDYRYRRK